MSAQDLGPAFGAGGVGTELFRTNTQAQQFVSMISALFKRMAPLYDPDNALLNDANAWTHVLRDDRFRAFINMRLAKVARLNWTMEPGGDSDEDVALAGTVESILRGVHEFGGSRRHLAKMAFWGRSPAWIEGARKWSVVGVSESHPAGLLAEWWVPTYLRPLDKRQVIYKPETITDAATGEKRVTVTTLLGTIDSGVHAPMKHPECLVVCRYDDEVERLGYGRGLLETLYHVYWVKDIVRRLGLAGLEKWANGIVAAGVDSTARTAADQTAQQAAAEFLETLMTMRANGAIVHDVKDTVQLLTMSGSGGELTLKWLAYCDEGASMLCSGSVRPMGGGEGGTYGQGKVEAETSDDLLDNDRDIIDETITRQVVGLILDMNASALAEMGLASAKPPRFKSMHQDREDPEKFLRTVKLAQECGMQIPADDAHRRSGIPRPADDDDVLEAPKPEPSNPFGGGGDPFGGPEGEQKTTDDDAGNPGKLAAWFRSLVRRGRRAA